MNRHERQTPYDSRFGLHWNSKILRTSLSHVPSVPGLYVIGRQKLFYNFEVKRKYVYIGQTNNLKKRLELHRPKTEQNIELRKYLQKYQDEIRCWYCPLVEISAEERLKLEQELIKHFRPKFNTQGNPRSK